MSKLDFSVMNKVFRGSKTEANSLGAQIAREVKKQVTKSDHSHNAGVGRGKFGPEDKIGLLQPLISYHTSNSNFVVGRGTVDSQYGAGGGSLFGNFGIFLQISGLFKGWSSEFGKTGGSTPPGYSSTPLGFAGNTPMGYIGNKPSGFSFLGTTVSKPGFTMSSPNTVTGAKPKGPTGPVIKK